MSLRDIALAAIRDGAHWRKDQETCVGAWAWHAHGSTGGLGYLLLSVHRLLQLLKYPIVWAMHSITQ